MYYQERFVAVIKLIDLKTNVEQTIDGDGYDRPDRIEILAESLAVPNTLIDKEDDWQLTQSIDTWVISSLQHEAKLLELCRYVLWLHIQWLEEGYWCQGGITQGKLIHTDQILFGPALIEAQDLQQAAQYPRVILSRTLMPHVPSTLSRFIQLDQDGYGFVDYLTKAQSELNFGEASYPAYMQKLDCLISKTKTKHGASKEAWYPWFEHHLSKKQTG